MRRKPLNDLVLSVVAFCVAVGPAAAQGVGESLAPLDEAALQGEFASDGGCESQPGPSYFNRVYHFALDGTWRMVRTIYADPACGRPLLTLRLAGTYSLGQASQTVTGAREAALGYGLDRIDPSDRLPVGRLRNGGTAFAGPAVLDLAYLLGENGGHQPNLN